MPASLSQTGLLCQILFTAPPANTANWLSRISLKNTPNGLTFAVSFHQATRNHSRVRKIGLLKTAAGLVGTYLFWRLGLMRLMETFRVGTFALILLFSACSQSSGAPSKPRTRTLSNGIRVAVVPFPNSTNVSLFTFFPMGLASDTAQRAQWSHLVEHLVIRSTFPDDLTHANAETGPDNMRLDFYGHTESWKDAN